MLLAKPFSGNFSVYWRKRKINFPNEKFYDRLKYLPFGIVQYRGCKFFQLLEQLA